MFAVLVWAEKPFYIVFYIIVCTNIHKIVYLHIIYGEVSCGFVYRNANEWMAKLVYIQRKSIICKYEMHKPSLIQI